MKKFALLTLSLCLCASLLVGCGCMNTGNEVTTLPTNGETVTPTVVTTVPTTAPTTAPTTIPTTQAPMDDTTGATDTTGTLEGAMDDIMGGSADDATDATGADRSRGRRMPRG